MTRDQRILIKNIYYMLAYAFQALRQSGIEELASEEFENIHDLLGAILAHGIARQMKQGLYREYMAELDDLPMLRGKLDVPRTIRNRLRRRQRLACEYDELSENNLFNRILKTAALILLRHSAVSPERRQALKKTVMLMGHVEPAEPSGIPWNRLRFHRNNRSYRMLLNVCYFVLKSLLLTTEKGKYKMASFLDEQELSRLYEKFVLEYFRYHHPDLRPSSSQVAWNVEEGDADLLPAMKTDITLRHGGRTLIIDTKFYSRITREHFDRQTLHSGNLYQIFTYVKNQDTSGTGSVSGMLLYARTDEEIAPDCEFKIGGNRFWVKTLDLNTEFRQIAAQLDHIADLVRTA